MTEPSDLRLYGVPDAETLHLDLAEAYQSQIEPERIEGDATPWVIEEWTVEPRIKRVPSAASIVDYLVEQVADYGPEDLYYRIADLDTDTEVLAAAEALRATFADHITYWTADEKVAEHIITWGADNEPLVDGKPLYRKSAP